MLYICFRVDSEFTVKIADFGLSKDVYERDYYRRAESSQTPLPIKWMALESLRNSGEFSSKSDVVSHDFIWIILISCLTNTALYHTTVDGCIFA